MNKPLFNLGQVVATPSDTCCENVDHTLKEYKLSDPTEQIRRQRTAEINSEDNTRQSLEAKHGQVWSTEEMQQEFEALGFMAPLIVVSRKSDGTKGSLEFSHSPRFYFNWQAD